MAHAVDLSSIINAENPDNLPVIIAGTSRGTISVVPNQSLASALALSSSLTSKPNGAIGTPIGVSSSPANLQATFVNRPVHISWHTRDACSVTTPLRSLTLSDKFLLANNKITTDAISGGFTDPAITNLCKAKTYHGFLGIESCAVLKQTNWMAGVVADLAGNEKSRAESYTYENAVVVGSAALTFDLTAIQLPFALVSDADLSDRHQFSTPYAQTTLGGSITITPTGLVRYTPPASVVSNTQDYFVYVVNDFGAVTGVAKGGTANNVITINLTVPVQ